MDPHVDNKALTSEACRSQLLPSVAATPSIESALHFIRPEDAVVTVCVTVVEREVVPLVVTDDVWVDVCVESLVVDSVVVTVVTAVIDDEILWVEVTVVVPVNQMGVNLLYTIMNSRRVFLPAPKLPGPSENKLKS